MIGFRSGSIQTSLLSLAVVVENVAWPVTTRTEKTANIAKTFLYTEHTEDRFADSPTGHLQ